VIDETIWIHFHQLHNKLSNIQLALREVDSFQNHFHQHFFFIFFIANEKNVWQPPSNFPLRSNEKTQGGYQFFFIWSKINNLTTIHYEKSHLWKPHYLATIIQKIIWTKKNNLYTIVMQLSFGYYNYCAIIPLKKWCINK